MMHYGSKSAKRTITWSNRKVLLRRLVETSGFAVLMANQKVHEHFTYDKGSLSKKTREEKTKVKTTRRRPSQFLNQDAVLLVLSVLEAST